MSQEDPLHGRILDKFGVEEESSTVHISFRLNINVYRSVEKIIDCSITGLLSCPKSKHSR